jgi:hypothetical protein
VHVRRFGHRHPVQRDVENIRRRIATIGLAGADAAISGCITL